MKPLKLFRVTNTCRWTYVPHAELASVHHLVHVQGVSRGMNSRLTHKTTISPSAIITSEALQCQCYSELLNQEPCSATVKHHPPCHHNITAEYSLGGKSEGTITCHTPKLTMNLYMPLVPLVKNNSTRKGRKEVRQEIPRTAEQFSYT